MVDFYERVLSVLQSDPRFFAEDGTFLRKHSPHGDWLYNYGFWRIHDLDTNKKIEIRN